MSFVFLPGSIKILLGVYHVLSWTILISCISLEIGDVVTISLDRYLLDTISYQLRTLNNHNDRTSAHVNAK